MKKKFFVIIPVYNEGEVIIEVIKNIPAFIDHIIVVDDCSNDGTKEIIESYLKNGGGRVTLMNCPRNMGVGGVTIMGFLYALELGADIMIKMDGDDQMDPKYLPNLLAPILKEDYEYTKANRLYGTSCFREMPPLRIFGNYVLTLLNKMASGYWKINDPQNGYIALKSDAFGKINLNHVNNRFAFENSLLIEGKISNLKVKDVNIPARYNGSKSHIKLPEFINIVVKILIQGYIRRKSIRYYE